MILYLLHHLRSLSIVDDAHMHYPNANYHIDATVSGSKIASGAKEDLLVKIYACRGDYTADALEPAKRSTTYDIHVRCTSGN